MSTSQQAVSEELIIRRSKLDQLDPFRRTPRKKIDPRSVEKALRISSLLQTTLDAARIIEIFASELADLIPHDHVAYSRSDSDLTVTLGNPAIHSCSFHLVTAEQEVGTLTLTRSRRFTAKETRLIEYLVCVLMYPLRNAMLYHNALEAALRDPLTGINNRAAMDRSLGREIDLAHRHGGQLSLLTIDIDRFKTVNDRYGHLVGDEVIRSVAKTINSTIRGSDMLFRYGGEEFTVLLSSTAKRGALQLAERIRRNTERARFFHDDEQIPITVSVGCACLKSEDDGQALFLRADQALYSAKAAGRNSVRFTDHLAS